MWEDGIWNTTFFLATAEEKVQHEIENNSEFRKVVTFKVHDIDGQDMPDDIVVRDLG